MTDEELSAIEKRALALLKKNRCALCYDPAPGGVICATCRNESTEENQYELPLVVELAGEIPSLIAEIRRLRDEIDELDM